MIGHPFVADLSNKTLDELTDAVNKLSKNLSFAARTGRYGMADQINMLLESYRSEINRQQRDLLDGKDSLTGGIDIQ